jgi:hypothetical protein
VTYSVVRFCNLLVLYAVRMTVLYADHQYLVVHECFDYTASQEGDEEGSQPVSIKNKFDCPRENSSLAIYGKSREISRQKLSDLASAANLPATCSSSFQTTLQGKTRILENVNRFAGDWNV